MNKSPDEDQIREREAKALFFNTVKFTGDPQDLAKGVEISMDLASEPANTVRSVWIPGMGPQERVSPIDRHMEAIDKMEVMRATISAQEGTIKRLQKELSELNKWIHSHL